MCLHRNCMCYNGCVCIVLYTFHSIQAPVLAMAALIEVPVRCFYSVRYDLLCKNRT